MYVLKIDHQCGYFFQQDLPYLAPPAVAVEGVAKPMSDYCC
jgi:hypothetical protein